MSTSVNPSAAPLEAPAPAGPKPVTPEPRQFSGWKSWIFAAALVVLGFAGWYIFKPRPAQKLATVVVTRTAAVRTGVLERTIRITGTTVAGKYANIAAPLLRGPDAGRALTLVSLANPGSWAKKGDVVAQIDTTAAKDHIDDVEAMVQSSEADIRKRKAEHAIEEETLRQSIRVSKASLDKIKLDAGASEIRTPIDQELIKLTIEENEAAYKQLVADFQTHLASNRSELRLLEIARERNIRHRDRHISDMVRFTIKTPMDGLVVMLSLFRGGDMGQIRVGDQMAPNQPFMRIVDPNSMQVDATVNQVEAESLRVGQPAVVHFDAFPGIRLRGRVHALGAIAIGGWRQNYYIRNIPVKITMQDQDPRVIPDLSAGADVVVAREENVLLAPREAIHQQGGKNVVYVRHAGKFETRPVQVGSGNNTHVAVVSGLKDGEVVALETPPSAPQS